jgi:hypothetical protein
LEDLLYNFKSFYKYMELNINRINYDTIEDNVEDNFIDKMNIMKDLPIECQIDKYDVMQTYHNLYSWYQHNDDNISRIPEPFYGDFILVKTMTCINILNTRDLNQELLNYFKNK